MVHSSHLDFQYPLNVYAHLLHLELGKVDYLHYGLFDHAGECVSLAQQRSTDLVLKRLPAAPASILEIGIGTGTTLGSLVEAGHRVTGISPDPGQIRLAERCLASLSRPGAGAAPPPGRGELECVGFEDYSGGPGAFDAVLLQESFQYVDGPQLFTRAQALLAPGGQLLILDEFLGRPDSACPIHLPALDTTRALAKGSGFAIEEELDLTSAAAPTVDYLLDRIELRRQGLLAELPVDDEQLRGLESALREYRTAYADGTCRYALLSLRKQG